MNTTLKISLVGFSFLALGGGCSYGANQLVSLNTDSATSTPAVTSTQPVVDKPAVDTRIAVTADALNTKSPIPMCDNVPELNKDEPNTTVPFKNEEMGIELAIPYNEKWGTAKFKLEPVEDSSNEDVRGIGFGPANIFGEGGCAFMRHFHLNVKPKRAVKEITADLLKHGAIFENEIGTNAFNPKIETFKGKQVITYSLDGICGNTFYEVVGEKNNYEITGWCNDESLSSSATIYQVIESLKFI